ncbi:flavodoxin family protein [Kribbella shirazensis]|uniref:Flavodoxin-like domain-containing protein n=1 Tax=Kribbella shirazensis TaxID=1105143 RepID=A0A7X5VDF6_9ACTN|nr:flavodoxin domain-containing protein [Kribbella shirazensis]NIK59200.1 hypothetical protein [Kribbella shirazensis]
MSEKDRAVIVYESMFGNTEQIARAIRDGLRAYVPAETVPVNQAPDAVSDDVRLLVVGGPTHAFSMSRLSTRQEAGKQADLVTPVEVGIREWLAVLKPGTEKPWVATFDTRVKVRLLPGSAARSAAKLLRRMGYRLSDSASFFVSDTTGPIRDDELERAQHWGEELGRRVTGSAKVA